MENITQALAVTLFGIIIVFLVLIILMVILNIMKLFASEDNAPKEEITDITETAVAIQNDDELIAVLTAAVAASLNTKSYNLRIKSYKRLY